MATASERIHAARLWNYVADWLKTPEADWFVDDAVMGSLPVHEADALLAEFDIVANVESRRTLALLIDDAIKA